jgi:hypothetical protein
MNIAIEKVWKIGFTLAFAAAGILLGGHNPASAQELVSSADADESDYYSRAAPFSGSWNYRGNWFDEDEACGHWTNPNGQPVIRCSLPIKSSATVTAKGNQGLESYLHPRALAFREFVDERLSTKWFCLPPSLPASLDGMTHIFDFLYSTELRITHSYYWDTRVVWMDGRRHPGGAERFYNGHSIGRFEGEDLVIETTNFLFDPDGLDDHLHLPSSPLKKVTERYRPVDDDTMLLNITVEDPLFLLKPFSWTIELAKAQNRPEGVYNCDTEFNFAEIDGAMRDPYANADRTRMGERPGDTRSRD